MFFSGYLFVFSSVPQSNTGVSCVSSETFPASHTALKELLNLKGSTLLSSCLSMRHQTNGVLAPNWCLRGKIGLQINKLNVLHEKTKQSGRLRSV